VAVEETAVYEDDRLRVLSPFLHVLRVMLL
jgi:hypothetical protein